MSSHFAPIVWLSIWPNAPTILANMTQYYIYSKTIIIIGPFYPKKNSLCHLGTIFTKNVFTPIVWLSIWPNAPTILANMTYYCSQKYKVSIVSYDITYYIAKYALLLRPKMQKINHKMAQKQLASALFHLVSPILL